MYNLSIITPTGKTFQEEIESLMAPGKIGSFGVLSNHTPMIAALKSGVLKIKQQGSERFFALNSGVLEVSQKKEVLILCDSAEETQNEDQAREKVKNFS